MEGVQYSRGYLQYSVGMHSVPSGGFSTVEFRVSLDRLDMGDLSPHMGDKCRGTKC